MKTVKGLREILQNYKNNILAEYNNGDSDISDIVSEGFDAQALVGIEGLVMSEEELWKVFAETRGCKKDKEDCCFKKCHSWAECDLLIDAIRNAMLGKLEGKE